MGALPPKDYGSIGRRTAIALRRAGLAVGAIALALTVGLGTARAAPVDFKLTLTPTWIGSETPVVGFTSVPSLPFVGSFTVDSSQVVPNEALTPFFSPLHFHLTIGTAIFSDPTGDFIQVATDSAGNIDELVWSLVVGDLTTGLQLNIDFNDLATISGWSLWDHSVGPVNECGVPFPVTGSLGVGGCLGGDGPRPNDLIAVDRVPEPMSLALFGVGLAGLGLAHRRRATALRQKS